MKAIIRKLWPVLLGVLFVSITGYRLFGGVDGCLAALQGKVAVCRVVEVNDHGREKVLVIELRNLTSSQLEILGGNTNCKCATLGEIPSFISAFGAVPVSATFVRSSNMPSQSVRVAFVLNSDSQREVRLVYDGS